MNVILDEDYELVQQFQAGIKKAFEQLFLKYQQKIFTQCYYLLLSREDAEDAAQEAFCNVYKNIHTFKCESKFSTWLYQITKNHCLNLINKRNRNGATDIEDIEKIGSDSENINSVDDCVKSKLAQLEEIHRSVIAFVHYAGMTFEEAAKVLECPVGTIRSRLNRAREKLKPMLKECLE